MLFTFEQKMFQERFSGKVLCLSIFSVKLQERLLKVAKLFYKKVLCKISQNAHGNNCDRALFSEVAG